ncbi:MAG: hypothetical protein FJ148_10995 [Deltaproteobacteria bacterium]|nr:hypothetical protein [Deltaproteobacteria bacterium]
MAGEPLPSEAPALRRATIAFVDILGFSALSTRAGPETACRIVSGLLKLLDEIARRHGGAVDKYLGDAMMVVFGVPFAVPHAERAAVAAAAAMLDATAAYRRQVESPEPLALHIGINTGDVLASDVRGAITREFAVMGDAVNVAARLKERAPAGGVYLGHDTWTEARADFAFTPLEPLRLKGKEKVVACYALERAPSRGVTPEQLDVFAATPFQGRTAELARLLDRVAALHAGAGGVTIVSGASGVGKSRLCRELVARVDASTVEVHRPSFRDPATAGELADLNARLRARPVPRPVLVVCDDLHDAAEECLLALRPLCDLACERPVLCVLVLREPGARAIPEGPAAAGLEIALGPLAATDCDALVAHVARERALSPATRALVVRRAAGNPLRLITAAWLAGALETESALAAGEPERGTEAERRRATVLFADITGFTRMSEQMEVRAAREIVSGCLRVLHEVAVKHGGTVEKYLGDCVLAVFGVPVALEDAPRAAVNASIEMLRRVREYSAARGLEPPLGVHVGIDTGLSIAADVSGPVLREFALMGDSVGVASLLKDVAPPGRVYVGTETWRATRRDFAFEAVPDLPLGGRGGSTPAYALLSEREQIYRPAVGTGETLFERFVSRERELASLRGALAALTAGQGGVAFVVGEPGLGKSRLLAELAASPEAGALEWLQGRSVAIGRGLRYHPLVDLLRAFAGVAEGDDEVRAAERLRRRVHRACGPAADDVFPFVATVMGVPLAAAERERLASVKGEALDRLLVRGLKELLVVSARERPLVLVFEDLHWADLSSSELLIDVIRIVLDAPILILAAARPGFAETAEAVRDAARTLPAGHVVEIELEPLAVEDTRRLLTSLFPPGDLPRQVRDRVETQAAGNPLYVEEVLRALLEQGHVEVTPLGLRATAAVSGATIPATVQEVVLSRLDWLPPHRKQAALAASVIGRSFTAALLGRITGATTEIEAELRELVAAQLLVEQSRGGVVEYAFKHRMIQQAAYESLLESKRRELHGGVAEAVRAELPESSPGYFGMLAYHFGMAGDADRAEEFLFKAGDEAARVAATAEALAFFEEASELFTRLHGDGADARKLADLEKRLAGAFLNRGHMVDASRHFNRAIELLGKRVPRHAAEMTVRAATTLVRVAGDVWLRRAPAPRPPARNEDRELIELMFDRARAQTTADPTRFVFDATETLRTLRAVDPTTVRNAGGMYAGMIGLFSFGGVSFSMSERFLALAERYVRADDVAEVFLVRMMRFFHHFLAGDWDRRHEIDAALVDAAVGVGQLWDVASHLGLEAAKLVAQGRFAQAEQHGVRIQQIEELYSYDLARSNRHSTLAFLYTERRELDRALAAAQTYVTEHEDPNINLIALSVAAKVRVLRGEIDEARATMLDADRLRARMGRVPPLYSAHLLRSRLMLQLAELGSSRAAPARGALGAARRTARGALAAAAKVAWLRPEVLRLVGCLHELGGRRRRALHTWTRALTEGERLGTRPENGRTHAALANALAWTPALRVAGGDAAEHLAVAREEFRVLGLTTDLAALEGVVARRAQEGAA